MFTHILLASDGSECALKATEFAGTLARKFDARLTVLHVFTLPASAVMPFATSEPAIVVDPALIQGWAASARDTVERGTAQALEALGVAFVFRQEIGHPAETIVTVADAQRCDLIVLGSRGLSGVKALLLGSVSSQVSHHAHCPVLIVR